ncbi:MAG TPA: hypothetical protein VGK73_29180 [Polyangiaceae bacterium]
MQTRRQVLKGVLGAVGVAVVAEQAAAGPLGAATGGEANADIFANLPDLQGTRVLHVAPVVAGAVPLILEGPSGPYQVDVCRASASGARGIAKSGRLELFVHNGGRGDVATASEHVLAMRALATELSRREAAGARIPQLLTWRERQELVRGNEYTVDVLASYLAGR